MQIAQIYMDNMRYRAQNASSFNRQLPVASQMYGSGKTWLGNHLLWKLRDADVKQQYHKQKGTSSDDSMQVWLRDMSEQDQGYLAQLLKSVYPPLCP